MYLLYWTDSETKKSDLHQYDWMITCPDLCIAPVYESALPPLLLLLLIELCLSDLFLLLIKLHKDLNVTDPSLQQPASNLLKHVLFSWRIKYV